MVNFSNIAVVTELNGGITDSASSLVVDAATGYPAVPFHIKINAEVILVGAKSGTTFSTLTRGVDDTTAAAHSDTDEVTHVVIAKDMVVPSSAWPARLWTPAGTPHADDLEFEGTTVTGTEGTGIGGTVNWAQGGGVLHAEYFSQATEDLANRTWPLTPTAAPVTIECALRVMSQDNNFSFQGICFSDGTADTANAIAFNLLARTTSQAPGVEVRSGTFQALATIETGVLIGDHVMGWLFLRLVWTAANTFDVSVSQDGEHWTDFDMVSHAFTLTPSRFGVGVSKWNGGAEKNVVSWEYLRVTESDLS